MKTELDDSTRVQLKILVERVVRPVRTSTARRLRMRKELLTHVITAFEEEAARLGNDAQALIQTAQRFGDTAELTRELQASVPKPDWQMWSEQLVGYPERESILRRAVRHFVITAVLWLPVLPIFYFQGRMREWPISVGMPIIALTFTLLIHVVREALFISPSRDWKTGITVLMISAVAMPAATFGMCWTISHSPLTGWIMVLPLIPISGLLTPIALAVVAYVSSVDLRQLREWETLPLAE